MTRRESRKNAFLLIFQYPVNPAGLDDIIEAIDKDEIQTDDFCLNLLGVTIDNVDAIDDTIKPHLKKWTLNRLPRVSLAVLRISCAQLLYMPDLPESVIINEAVEITKEFGDDDEYSFVNGALRSISETVRAKQ
jgi:transcription antitermination factor NusB